MDAREFFEKLERNGDLQPLLAFFQSEIDIDEKQLRSLIREVLITDAATLAKIHAYQGRLSAYANLLKKVRTLGERQPLPKPE